MTSSRGKIDPLAPSSPATRGETPNSTNRSATLAALIAMNVVGATVVLLKPVIVGALVDSLHMTPTQAGFTIGAEMLGATLATAVCAVCIGNFAPRTLILAGLFIAIVSGTLSAVVTSFALLAPLRFVCGTGSGLIASTVLTIIAGSSKPDRAFSILYVAAYLAGAIEFPLMIRLIAAFGAHGAFMVVAALFLPLLPLVTLVPKALPSLRRPAQNKDHAQSPGSTLILAASFLYFLGTGGTWSFIERIGSAGRLPGLATASILGASQVAAVLAAASAGVLGTRFGRAAPITASIILSSIALIVLSTTPTMLALYATAVITFIFAWLFLFPFLSGAMASIDPGGRINVLGMATQNMAMAAGPAVAGLLVVGGSYRLIPLAGLCCQISSLPLMLLALRYHSRSSIGKSEATATVRPSLWPSR